jgi:predicted ABC-type transport system involved in lysophospholipase L1 biosynthesis ATPase subunit
MTTWTTTEPPEGRTIIEARGIVKTYGDPAASLAVLQGVDLTIHRGEIVALEGRSGSGKSTLLKSGLSRSSDSGTYLLGGSDVSKLGPREQAWVRLLHRLRIQSFHLIPRDRPETSRCPYYAGLGRAAGGKPHAFSGASWSGRSR